MRISAVRSSVVALLAAVACGQEADPDVLPDAGPEVTWHQQIAPIVTEHCGGCHVEGGIGPFKLTTFADAAPLAPSLLDAVDRGIMPPWNAKSTEDCAPRLGWEGDLRLDDDEVALLREWVELGAPEGDAASAAPLPELPTLHLDEPTHTVEPETAYVSQGTDDQFRCFLIDPGIVPATWMTGIEFLPGNLNVVHHAALRAAPRSEEAALRALVGPDGSFDCFGMQDAQFLGVWVPGTLPYDLPAGVGIPLPENPLFVLNLHYHPHGTVAEPDVTSVALRLTETAPEHEVEFLGFGAANAAPRLLPGPNDREGVVEFRIPAGVADHTETMRHPVVMPVGTPVGVRKPIVSLFPHQHYVGVQIEAKISRGNPKPGEPADECLIDVPTWNFDWQRTYRYAGELDELPTVGAGDEVTVRCHYDNTLANPFLARGLSESGLASPIDVFLGGRTMDDMCNLTVAVLK